MITENRCVTSLTIIKQRRDQDIIINMAKYGAIQDEDNAAVFRGSSSSSSGNNEINGHERLISTWLRVTAVAAAVLLVFYFPR